MIGAGRQLCDRLQGCGVRMLADVVGQRLDAVDAELGHHLAQPLGALVVAGHQGEQIALDLHRLAHVRPHDRQQVLVHLACARKRHDRHAQPLFVHLPAVGPEAASADVHHVHGRREQPHRPLAEKSRRHQREVVQVAGPEPRIVGEVVIACAHLLHRVTSEEMADRRRHRVHVPGRAGHGLRQHAALEIEHAGGQIAGFAHARAERGAQQRLGLLLDDGDQAVPHDLRADAGQCGVCFHFCCASKLKRTDASELASTPDLHSDFTGCTHAARGRDSRPRSPWPRSPVPPPSWFHPRR